MKIRLEVKNAMEALGIDTLRPHQNQPINRILDGKDTMVIAPTSFGKSLLYIIPAMINKEELTIVIEPLLALMHDQVEKLCKLGIRAAYLDHTQSRDERDEVLEKVRKKKLTLLYVSPERLTTESFLTNLKKMEIGRVVVDECHCVVSWGSTFREDYLKIGTFMDGLKHRPVVIALTATAVPEDQTHIQRLLSMHKPKTFCVSLYRSNLSFSKKQVTSRKDQKKQLEKLLKKHHQHVTLIFCTTKKAVESVAAELEKQYPDQVAKYHGADKRAERDILSGKKRIIVATSALSCGVDIKHVDLVIHFNLPMSLEDYYQMAGRGGREGQHARGILLYNPDDYYANQKRRFLCL